jgi:hypothetical protein
MPRFDGTGPRGTGPIGKGMGPCGGGMSFRRGFGRGFCYAPELTKEQEKEMLEAQKKTLEKRLKELE